ncbi:NAD(P)H-dependent glycerol-3-phosphate dehydrogenase [Borreliella carolinensis]|uniref:NAD(P)H-dependent glycerol-3-phosphate dehydrogenase n=1 Tax=Borreliella carolinensis TaxID=478174 RepID=UPI002943DB8E|nr:NAD(P)H-dependent glycerol-3-phosphate dehydrogenase [Borreliella carolinensis]WNY64916.1 NAD(P)H-dependent glycerol-3-phosphate dehydrogenase [Borreliella carolinensis]
MKISVIGAGAWGTAIAKSLSDKFDFNIFLWAFEEDVKNSINNDNINAKYLKGIKLPKNLVASSNLFEVATMSDYIFIATPSLFTVDILKKLDQFLHSLEIKPKLAILTKGFITFNGKTQTVIEAAERVMRGYKDEITYIVGPSHAEEVGLGVITGLVAASNSRENAYLFINLFSKTPISLFYSNDVFGVQIAAALKNVFAIAFGILDAYKLNYPNLIGSNTESLLFSISLNNIKDIAIELGGRNIETFLFLSGSGDLDVTCRSMFGRNRRFGNEIVSKNILENFLSIDDLISNIEKIGYLPEGVLAAKSIFSFFKQLNRDLNSNSLLSVIYKILNKELEPKSVIEYMRDVRQ